MAWSSAQFRARMVVDTGADEQYEFDVVKFTASFDLNGIPQCSVVVPVGRGGRRLRGATIHQAAADILQQQKMSLYVHILSQGGTEPEQWPLNEFRLFDGYVTGVGFQRANNVAAFTVHARHWLVDLDYSSSVSATSHPQNPAHFSYKATSFQRGGGGVSWTPFSAQGQITADTLGTDFYFNGLHPWMLELAGQDRINQDELSFLGAPKKNDSATKALGRFSCGDCYVPLKLDLGSADAEDVAAAIQRDVYMQTWESFANHTLWNKLVGEFASQYLFSIVPRVEDALVVPFVPGLREHWQYTIDAKHYRGSRISGGLLRTIRGVGLFAGLRARAGSDNREASQPWGRFGIGGWYSPADVDDGMVILKNGPRWLSGMTVADRYSQFSTGQGVKRIGNAIAPGVGPIPDGNSPEKIIENSKHLLDRFAHAMYVYEMTKQRQGHLSGKLRFDIAPGSTVRVEGADERFIPGDQLGQPFFASVLRVTIHMDTESRRAGTSFHLAHLRSAAENQQDKTSVERPPLWTEPWPGCSLLDEFG